MLKILKTLFIITIKRTIRKVFQIFSTNNFIQLFYDDCDISHQIGEKVSGTI